MKSVFFEVMPELWNLQAQVALQKRHVLVIEDDINIKVNETYFFRAFEYIFSHLKRFGWGILKVGYWPEGETVKHGNIRMVKGCNKTWTTGAFAYIVNAEYRSRYFNKLDTAWRIYLEGGLEQSQQADHIMWRYDKGYEWKVDRGISIGTKGIGMENAAWIPIVLHLEPRIIGHTSGWSDNWGEHREIKRRLTSPMYEVFSNSSCDC